MKLAFFAILALVLPATAFSTQELEALRIRIQPTVNVLSPNSKKMSPVPAGYPVMCSGFAVKTSKWRQFLVTARHCLPTSLQLEFDESDIKVDRFYFVVDDGVIEIESEKKPLQNANVFEIANKNLSSLALADIGFSELKYGILKATTVHPLARHLPTLGDRAYAVGYPGGFGPSRFQCRFVGIGARAAADSLYRLELKWELECPELQKHSATAEGISGGVVLNSRNQVIGVITEQLQSSPPASKERQMNRLGFIPLTRQNVNITGGLYRMNPAHGSFKSKYLDWTTGQEVQMHYTLKKGSLNGPLKFLNQQNEILESWELKNGAWGQ